MDLLLKQKIEFKVWKKLFNTPKIKGCKTYLIHEVYVGRP